MLKQILEGTKKVREVFFEAESNKGNSIAWWQENTAKAKREGEAIIITLNDGGIAKVDMNKYETIKESPLEIKAREIAATGHDTAYYGTVSKLDTQES